MIDAAVSAAAGGACAGSAALLYYAERLPGISRITERLHTDRIQSVCILTAAAAMVATPAGRWWNELVNNINTWLTGLVGQWTGLLVTGLPALFVLVMFANDMVTRRVEHRTRVLAALLPVLASTIPGPIGHGVVTGLGWLAETAGRLVGGAFGMA